MHCHQSRGTKGFTLIEIIVSLVIVTVLAAFVIPRFVELKSNAYRTSVSSFRAALESAVKQAHSKWQVSRRPSSIVYDGNTIVMTSTGNPGPLNMSTAQCITLVDNLLHPRPVTSLNYVPGADGYLVAAANDRCYYVYRKDKNQLRYVIYFAGTGLVSEENNS